MKNIIIILVFTSIGIPCLADIDSLFIDSLLSAQSAKIDSVYKNVSEIQNMKRDVDVYLKNLDLQSNAISHFSHIIDIAILFLLGIVGLGYFNQYKIGQKIEEVEKLKLETEEKKVELATLLEEGHLQIESASKFFKYISKLTKEVDLIDIPERIHNPTNSEMNEIIKAIDKIRLIKATGQPLNEKARLFIVLNHFYKTQYKLSIEKLQNYNSSGKEFSLKNLINN